MAKISISKLSIENLGPFREQQIIDLNVGADRPVILVKALNGSGKTTLLTAMQIGLYGYKAVSTGRRTDYEQLMLGLQRKDATGNSVVEIEVLVEMAGTHRQLKIRREWFRNSAGIAEEMRVIEGGRVNQEFSESWEEFIESILPVELVKLFLFDGEKIEALANPERLPDLLKRATEVFLGIGGIESLGNDLKAFERRTALKSKNSSAEFEQARASLQVWEEQAKELEEEIELLTQDQAAAQNTADQMKRSLEQYTVDAQRKGLAAYEQVAIIRNEAESSREQVRSRRASLAETISDPVLPIAWLSKLWAQYHEEWELDQQARNEKLLKKEFKKRDQRILSVFSSLASKSAIESLKQTLIDDLSSLTTANRASGASLQDAPPDEMDRQLREAKRKMQKELQSLQEAEKALERTELRIGQIPAEEQISEILHTLQKRTVAATAAESALTEVAHQLEEAHKQLAHVRLKQNAAHQRFGAEFRDHSLEGKSLAASVRARQTLIVFKERLLASKAQWLSEVITTEFRNLMHKQNLIAKVLIDPATYKVSIENGKHQELSMDRLSAGERQLLAISVLSALIKERKGRFPVVVDTPLARLDQQHRSALIKRFFATVSHQVVVLSTDQEVEGVAYETLKPYTNAEYSLDFDDSAARTTINKQAIMELAC